MAVYRIMIGENEYLIDISESGILINGEEIEASLFQLNEAGLYLLNHGEDKLELHMRVEGGNSYLVMADGKQVLAQVTSDRGQQKSSAVKSSDKDLRAPMPGLVISVNVAEGDQVEDGDVVCVLESMKMQMAIHAPLGGTIKEVAIMAEQRVEKDERLVLIE
ncbi:biotin/lipoyl-binding protein [bacterium]|nr:biotin/lipoyl-binding protein [bacterium]